MVSRWVAILKRTFGVRNRRSELMEVRSSKSRTVRKKTDVSAQQGLRVVVPAEVFPVICNCSCTLAPLAVVAQCPN